MATRYVVENRGGQSFGKGHLVRDGVCGCLIAEKLRVSHPTASEHLKILSQAGLIRGKRIKQWTFYKREEAAIRKMKKTVFLNV
jgi:DNA-binding transcriptional ArsR family regulator